MATRKLSQYHKKRDFRQTAEPSGKVEKSRTGHSYLIQKHAASHLHYDFRLELDGVLKSWAVTRGPSVDPQDRRLAVEVEDHPVAYGDFEGVIPKGQYGGGTVMLWDQGTWEPIGDPHASLKKGSLHFKLHGGRLKGEWTLVRMKDRPKDRGRHNWLLIKRSDRYAREGAGDTFLEKHSTSIATRRSMEQIARAADATWQSHRSEHATAKASPPIGKAKRRVSFPTIAPQLATLATEVPAGSAWVHEVKFDGYRVLTYIDHGKVRMMTRGGLDWTDKFGDLCRILAKLKVDSAVLDGELVAMDKNKVSSFNQLKHDLSEGGANLSYYVFDLLYLNGKDLRQEPLLARKKPLEALLGQRLPRVFYSAHFAEAPQFLDKACAMGLEGVISKRADAPYHAGRSKTWLKTKCHRRQEFVIGGYTRSSTGAAVIGSLLLGYYAGKDFVYAGRVGTGFDQKTARSLFKTLKGLERGSMAYTQYSDGGRRGPGWKRGVVWVEPKLVCEVEFTEWTEDGALRHPSFQGLREDKPAREVKRDAPISTAKAKEAAVKEVKEAVRASPSRKAAAGDVVLSHPEKMLWPEDGYTKQDLADYYAAVAKWILPHIADRPLSFVRCPAGSGKPCFFQRHSGEGMSPHIHTQKLRDTEPYLYIRDRDGLLALVQMGVLEIHQWGSHVKTWDRPDMIVFDFDPDEGLGFARVKEAAATMRERLQKLGLKSFLKTTGGKGLHVVVPITPEHDWDMVKDWARAMAELMAADAPEKYTTNIRKAARGGRIFIDYLRNGETATAVAPYSTRARPHAPVSVPLDWKELPRLKAGNLFTIATVPARLKKLKRDPWKDFFSTRQTLPLGDAPHGRRKRRH